MPRPEPRFGTAATQLDGIDPGQAPFLPSAQNTLRLMQHTCQAERDALHPVWADPHRGTTATGCGTAVLGRMPEATARNSGAQAITIPDLTKSVSRAHALIELHGRAVAISDSGSANGSARWHWAYTLLERR